MTVTTTIKEGEGSDPGQTFVVGAGSGRSRLIQPGTILDGKYLIQSMLGRGGMGCVFKAEHTILKKIYALKVLSPNRVEAASLRRFEAEGRVIAKLDHPVIVKVHNMGVDSGDCPFYVMDLLAGVPLSDLCGDKWRGSMTEVVELFRDIADGLAYAHEKGVIHRDIKPSNIVILRDSRGTAHAKLVDFGIAKIQQESQEGQSQTREGDIFGSPYYMSPEQSLGKPCDQRSDIYSLGCTLFEVMTGSPPFKGKSSMETLMLHQTAEAPRLSQIAPDKDFGAPLEQLVAKMLAKNPNLRYQTMRQVIHDTDRILAGKTVGKNALELPELYTNEQARDDDDDNEQDERGEPQSTNIFLALAACVGAIVIAGSVYFYFPHSNKGNNSNIGTAPKETGVATSSARTPEKVPMPNIPDIPKVRPLDKKNIAMLQNFHAAIGSTTFRKGGELYRRFSFPSLSIGTIMVNHDLQHSMMAHNHAEVPADYASTELGISGLMNAEAVYCAKIYSLVKADEFNSLHLYDFQGTRLNDEGAKQEAKNMLQILRTATHWTKLDTLKLETLPLTDIEIKDLPSDYPHLRRLELKGLWGPKNMSAQLAMWPLLKKIESFRMYHCGTALPCVDKLVGQGVMTELELDSTELTEPVIQKLQAYNKLEVLTLQGQELPDSTIDALAKMSSLKKINLPMMFLTEEQIFRLLKTSKNVILVLDSGTYDPQTLNNLSRTSRVQYKNFNP